MSAVVSAAEVLLRLRRFLLVLSVSLFGGALIELWLVGHTKDTIQWLPFALCILGSLAVLLVLFRPGPGTIKALRICMAPVALGTLLGIYLHVEGNISFAREIEPNSPTTDLVLKGLAGANPLLAPGILAVAAVLAVAATYRYTAGGQK
ncbi:MAG: hypothetical protein ABI596_08515 [Pyrinomonadaceae bacterium]